jgi:hypothetical protein
VVDFTIDTISSGRPCLMACFCTGSGTTLLTSDLNTYTLWFIYLSQPKQIINVLAPEKVYQKGQYYDELGYYIGIIDEYPFCADYFARNHCFRVPTDGRGNPSKINKVFIREIKK